MKENGTKKGLIHLTFKQQMKVCFAVFIVDIFLAHWFQSGVFHNLSWVLWGALFLLNPVWPERWSSAYPESGKKGARIAGGIMVIIGLIFRFGI